MVANSKEYQALMPKALCISCAKLASICCAGTVGSLSGQSAPKTQTQTAERPQEFQLSEGKGWKMGFDRRPHNPGSFSALLGGDDWSMALSRYEYDDFVKVSAQLSCSTKQCCVRSC